MLGRLKKLFTPKRPAEVGYVGTPEKPPKVVQAGPMTTTQTPAVPVDGSARDEPEP